jgi:hypothetical protein
VPRCKLARFCWSRIRPPFSEVIFDPLDGLFLGLEARRENLTVSLADHVMRTLADVPLGGQRRAFSNSATGRLIFVLQLADLQKPC